MLSTCKALGGAILLMTAVARPAFAQSEVETLRKLVALQQSEIASIKKILPDNVDPVFASGYCGSSGNFSTAGYKLECDKALDKTIPAGTWLVTLSQRVYTNCTGSLSNVTFTPSFSNAKITGHHYCETGTNQGRDLSTCSLTFIMKNDKPLTNYHLTAETDTSKSATVQTCDIGIYQFELSAYPYMKR